MIDAWKTDDGAAAKRVLVLSSTPRNEGNSRCLAESVADGAREAGHDVRFVALPEHVKDFLGDCRHCRRSDGTCSIEDDHAHIFLDLYLNADAVVYASPIWWYGISARLKAFLDRMFCYQSASYPGSDQVVEQLMGKRAALVLSAEESNFAARSGIVTQISEMCRYLHHEFVGIIVGIGNSREEVQNDPANPMQSAFELGQRLFDIQPTDYKLDTDRPNRVWADNPDHFPATWR